jgi:hypothetical protein
MLERSTFLFFCCLASSGDQPIMAEVASHPELIRVTVEDASAVEWAVLSKGKMVTARILKEAGVLLRWSEGDCLFATVTFSRRTPETLLPGAIAYALPYAVGGVRIAVFLDRLQPVLARSPNTRGDILGHVMAHELVHVLQGIARHSDRGLMKARWSEDDFQRMGVRPLEFTPGDLVLVRRGLSRARTLADTVAR